MAALGREVVNLLLLGPRSDGRLIHDSPIRGDVWAAFAASPGRAVDVLIEVYRDVPTGLVAARLARRLHRHAAAEKHAGDDTKSFEVSMLEGTVAARLTLGDLARAVLPYTSWARDLKTERPRAEFLSELEQLIRQQLKMIARNADADAFPVFHNADPSVARMAATFRILAALEWASTMRDGPEEISLPSDFLRHADPDEIARFAVTLCAATLDLRPAPYSLRKPSKWEGIDIFAVSRNRPIELAIERSVPAIKADAVSALFAVSCERVGWAVLDTGIDCSHPAFKDRMRRGRNRIVATYDFTRLRQVVLTDYLYNDALLRERAAALANLIGANPTSVRKDLRELAQNASDGRTIDWSIAEKYVLETTPSVPINPHGTHVAGILGGCWLEEDYKGGTPVARRGVCPDIKLYDFRVVNGSTEDTEFALMGALQYIRYFNGRNNVPRINGVNISLSIPHDVRNYACGRTPVCEEATRAVESGIVVVVAAGNRGYQSYHLSDGGAFETYAPSSITDPGNAEAVITVGATHRSSPHSYGVSFFSSRGPTGDGRPKPDLVAPGEKIWSTIPGASENALSGTSMAAPHVSGAAAMLMGRNPEFVGRATEIKAILCGTCTDLGRDRNFQGAGMLDILRAMQRI